MSAKGGNGACHHDDRDRSLGTRRGKVQAIDTSSRTATLQFADGRTYKATVRPDVDLSQYRVGDNVVIQVSQRLAVIAGPSAPAP